MLIVSLLRQCDDSEHTERQEMVIAEQEEQ